MTRNRPKATKIRVSKSKKVQLTRPGQLDFLDLVTTRLIAI